MECASRKMLDSFCIRLKQRFVVMTKENKIIRKIVPSAVAVKCTDCFSSGM